MSRKENWEKKMHKEISDEKADKLLEEEMIREAKMIEDSLLGNQKDDIPISAEEVDKSYQRFLKRLQAEGMLDENQAAAEADMKTAEIVKFPGSWEKTKNEDEILKNDVDILAEFSDKLINLEKEERKPWYKYGMSAGIALLAAVGILAGSLASQADSAKFVSTIQHIIYKN